MVRQGRGSDRYELADGQDQFEKDLRKMSYVQLKRYLADLGVPKEELKMAAGKTALLRLGQRHMCGGISGASRSIKPEDRRLLRNLDLGEQASSPSGSEQYRNDRSKNMEEARRLKVRSCCA